MRKLIACSWNAGLKTNCFRFSNIKNINVDLYPSDLLVDRHIGPDAKQTEQMLKVVGASSLNQLVMDAIPQVVRDPNPLKDGFLTDPIAQSKYLEKLREIMKQNKLYQSYIGYGYYPTITPSVILRNVLENPGWYTPYTPYQAQISQGRLEALINYQTVIQQMTGLPISNASLLDQGSAGGEALYMGFNLHQGMRKKVFVDNNVFLTTQAVIQTKAHNLGIQIIKGDYKKFTTDYNLNEFFGVFVQSPDSNGVLHDFTEMFSKIQQSKSNVIKIVGSDLLALTVTKSPGQMGADVCYGSAQRFGIPMGYGGPYAGFFASKTYSIPKKQNVRKMPGRIIGISQDKHGNMALRMALQTRQQHIRRDKATSNICTAQALLANMTGMYAIYHGPKGLRKIGQRVHVLAQLAARLFQKHGYQVVKHNGELNIFDTFTLLNCNAETLSNAFQKQEINIRKNSKTSVSVSFSEVSTLQDVKKFNKILEGITKKNIDLQQLQINQRSFQKSLYREADYLKQKIFNTMHSESQMMRYLKSLQDKDIGLNKSMNTLGSCTMKLNAASEMLPMSWPQLNLHPFVPKWQASGYTTIINQLRNWLKQITNFDDISFQPNSGATGQYAGLKCIVAYLQSIKQQHRKICLIPTSAHGTNPASAVLAGLTVVPVQVKDGLVDMADFKAKLQKHSSNLAALMITFPSTAGRYDENIKQMIKLIHQNGGLVYFDGANMNSLVGYTSPGYLGADVCHLNLHKTFAIPHGGGGPGMGPIGVKKHLAPFLPKHVFSQNYKQHGFGSLTSSEYGSASILTISYGYTAMLGRQGVQKSTAYALLNANYLMKKLAPYYPILNNKEVSKCSHEFILDCSQIKKDTKITQQDIAKRMIDFGFHAPTMSFPTPGTLMIEPTESEDKGQLDRFAETLIKIHHEAYNNPEIVKNSPYTVQEVTGQNWNHKFTRQQAAYPLQWVKRRGKFWPSVGRINNVKGDKVLICQCPDISAYVQ